MISKQTFMLIVIFFLLFLPSSLTQGEITLKASPLVVMSYSFPDDDTIQIKLDCAVVGYISLGFGPGMLNVPLMIAFLSGSSIVMYDYVCYNYNSATKSIAQNSQLVAGSRTSTNTSVTFNRKLVSSDLIIPLNTPTNMTWAYATKDALVRHRSYGFFSITFKKTIIYKCNSPCAKCAGNYDNDCTSCINGTYLSENSCLNCTNNCSTCSESSSNCLSCEANYIFSDNSCIARDSNCNPTCATCKDKNANSCLSCFSTTFLSTDGSCLDCNSKCLACQKSKDFCSKCAAGFYLINNTCLESECNYPCFSCDKLTNKSKCLSCQDGQFLANNTCIGCYSTCLTCSINADNCTSCKSGKFLNNSKCVNPPCDSSCKTCKGGYTANDCTSCNDGYFLSNKACLKCDDLCKTCSGTRKTCLSCNTNYYLSQSSCLFKCHPSCLRCKGITANDCLTCSYPLLITPDGKCESSDLLSELKSSAEITPFFWMYWNFNTNNNTITIALKWNTPGHFTLGLASTMANCDMIIAEIINGQIELRDTWSKSRVTPLDDENIGGKNDLIKTGSMLDDGNGFKIVRFNRLLDTGDEYDNVLVQNSTEMSYAFSNDEKLSYHGSNYASFRVNFVQEFNGKAEILEQSSPLIDAHSIGLLIVWSFLIDIPIFIVRYFKNCKGYINWHSYLFLFLDIFTIAMVVIVLLKNSEVLEQKTDENLVIKAHFICGILVLVLIVIQHVGGYIIQWGKFESRMFQKSFHKYLGYLLYIFSKIVCLTGAEAYKNEEILYIISFFTFKKTNFSLGFLIFYIIWSIFIMGLYRFLDKRVLEQEIPRKKYHPSSKQSAKQEISNTTNVIHPRFKQLIEDLNSFKTTSYLLVRKYSDLNWCLYYNKVCDLSSFKHPGGNSLIADIKGRETSRFIYGNHSLETSNVKSYIHSSNTLKILNSLFVGNINYGDTNIFVKNFNDNNIWAIKRKTRLSRSIVKLDFYNPNVKVKNYMKGVKWIGRHFSISPADKKITMRIYTTVLCFTKLNTDFRKNLIDYYKSLINNKPFQTELLKIEEKLSIALPFVIKRYSENSNSFANFLLNSTTNQTFVVKGPFGLGLEINEKMTGNIVIICAGTGILPFVDLFDYLLKKSIYSVLHKVFGKEVAEKGNPFKEDYNATFGDHFNVKLFAAFNDKEEFGYLNFLQTLYEINIKYDLNYFSMCLRFGDSSVIAGVPTTSSYFDKEFLMKNIKPHELDRILICGSQTMNSSLVKICKEMNIMPEKVTMV